METISLVLLNYLTNNIPLTNLILSVNPVKAITSQTNTHMIKTSLHTIKRF